MKIEANTANAKRAHIQTLPYLGIEPRLRILEENVSPDLVCEREKYWIEVHSSPYLLNSTKGGEGIKGKMMSVYSLVDPRSDVIFYVGVASDVHARLDQHIRDAREINGLIDRVERQRMSWRCEERELIYSGADAEATARALGRTVEAVRSHTNLYVSSRGVASRFVKEALQAALNLHKTGKLKLRPSVKFYDEEPRGDAKRLDREIFDFAKTLAGE